MEDLLIAVTRMAALAINAIALVVVSIGTAEAFASAVKLMLAPTGSAGGSESSAERRIVWLRYARWLVAGLTFQLAADIVESSIAATWEAVGRLAAVAAIRTFLDYFLERDLVEVRERQHESARNSPAIT